MKEVNMSSKQAVANIQARLDAVMASIEAIAEREESIAANLRFSAATGGVPPEYVERARARADTIMRLAADLRNAVGLDAARRW